MLAPVPSHHHHRFVHNLEFRMCGKCSTAIDWMVVRIYIYILYHTGSMAKGQTNVRTNRTTRRWRYAILAILLLLLIMINNNEHYYFSFFFFSWSDRVHARTFAHSQKICLADGKRLFLIILFSLFCRDWFWVVRFIPFVQMPREYLSLWRALFRVFSRADNRRPSCVTIKLQCKRKYGRIISLLYLWGTY